jgi:hypothetical protein
MGRVGNKNRSAGFKTRLLSGPLRSGRGLFQPERFSWFTLPMLSVIIWILSSRGRCHSSFIFVELFFG